MIDSSTPPLVEEIVALGLESTAATELARSIAGVWTEEDAVRRWSRLVNNALTPELPPAVHVFVFRRNYADWNPDHGPAPAWVPGEADLRRANVARLSSQVKAATIEDYTGWAAANPSRFWEQIIDVVGVPFHQRPRSTFGRIGDSDEEGWLPGARLNAAELCFRSAFRQPDSAPVVIGGGATGPLKTTSRGELFEAASRVAGALRRAGVAPGDGIGIVLPLSTDAVAVFLGIVLAGAVAVCIPESFSASEIGRRLKLGHAKWAITATHIVRGEKRHPLYDKLVEAGAPRTIVLRAPGDPRPSLRDGDVDSDALLAGAEPASAVARASTDGSTVLFSSGTTGEPKAIPWTHTTPIKCVADGHIYHDLQPGDVLAWPTALGWMMGPWLIYAGLANGATLALSHEHPASAEYCRFVERAGVTVLGVVPSLVAAWADSGAWDAADWSQIRAFSSTGECSDADRMLVLMSRADYRPVIEYCGGTEIGGGYIASTLLRPNAPATFNQPALGMRLDIRDDTGSPAKRGEVFLDGPSIGLSSRLLNGDHSQVYYAETPLNEAGRPLRRHGDELEELPNGYYRVLGRADDALNLGGIKVAAPEIERVLNGHPALVETAAVASSDGRGPTQLVVFAVPRESRLDCNTLRDELQRLLAERLNPLFKVAEVRLIESLPRTASNKMMRRLLRAELQETVV